MAKGALSLLTLSTVVLGCLGCRGGSLSFSYVDHRPRRIAHVCDHDCHHHYYDGSRLVILQGHRHGSGCGHRWSGKFWVSVARAIAHAPAIHVCNRDCHHHYHNGSRLVVLTGHRHGPGCGHGWTGKRWVISKGAKLKTFSSKATTSKGKGNVKRKAKSGKPEKSKSAKTRKSKGKRR